MYATVLRTKPASRAFALALGAQFPAVLGLAPVALAKVVPRVALHPSLGARSGRTLGLAGVALAKVASRRALRPSLAARSGASLGLAAVSVSRTRLRVSLLLRSS